MSPTAAPALLLLADGRFPAGGHAHSAGIEAAVADGRVVDVTTLSAYLEGRLRTAGLVEAALAAATVRRVAGLEVDGRGPGLGETRRVLADLDAEADARIPVLGLRAASRRLGRQLLRASGRCWPGPLYRPAAAVDERGLHVGVAWGVVGASCGLSAREVASLVVHHTTTTPAQAAVRLLGLDPFESAAAVAATAAVAVEVAEAAANAAEGPLDHLPADGTVLCDLAAERHALMPARLFTT